MSIESAEASAAVEAGAAGASVARTVAPLASRPLENDEDANASATNVTTLNLSPRTSEHAEVNESDEQLREIQVSPETGTPVTSSATIDNGTSSAEFNRGAPARTSAELPQLPAFSPAAKPNFRWGALTGEEFCDAIRSAYSEAVHWRRNVFMVPSGKIGKQFVGELTSLFSAYAQHSAMEVIVFDAAMVACTLLLQKPQPASKSRDHVQALERRLKAWREGDIDGLMREGRTIQNHLNPSHHGSRDDSNRLQQDVRIFTKLIFEGKIHSALRYISENQSKGVLQLNEITERNGSKTVFDVLLDKHPPAREVDVEALVTTTDEAPEVHPVLFERLTGSAIRTSALRTQGAAGPSGIDAAGWRRICTSFHRESTDLCASIATAARRLCTEFVDPHTLNAFLSCRLIPLDKDPGVRPIGICEVLRRIIGKAVMAIVKKDVISATGPLQLCGGQEAGCEAAVHAMRSVFEASCTDGILFVDATNAFNNLNRQVALLNIRYICPSISVILINCYRLKSCLYVGGSVLHSEEGTTQGDPLAMAMFALATLPLIKAVATPDTIQTWFADDAGSGGRLSSLRQWWDALVKQGPKFGYYPNATKTYLMVKSSVQSEAEDIFSNTGVQITTEGRRYLGGALGSTQFIQKFLKEKSEEWTSEVQKLAKFAAMQPHASFVSFIHGLINRWVYTLRVTTCFPSELLQPLEQAISDTLLPALSGQPAPNETTRQLLALPCRLGGMGLVNPTLLPGTQQQASKEICQPLVKLILEQEGNITGAAAEQHLVKRHLHMCRRKELTAEANTLMSSLPDQLRRCAAAAQEKGVSSWLSAIPLERHGFSLHKGAFRDAIALRYGWPLQHLPQHCACGQPFSVDHALICRCGNYVIHRHNQLRDLTAGLLREVCTDVSIEPPLQPLSGEQLNPSANTEDSARLDIRANGFWESSQDAFFDVRVFHPFASSYRNTRLEAVYRQHEQKKRNEYARRVREIERGSFTPLVMTTGGGMAREATCFYKRLASLLSEKRGEEYAVMIGWLRCTISFSLLKSSIRSVRGTRIRHKDTTTTNCESAVEAAAGGRLPL